MSSAIEVYPSLACTSYSMLVADALKSGKGPIPKKVVPPVELADVIHSMTSRSLVGTKVDPKIIARERVFMESMAMEIIATEMLYRLGALAMLAEEAGIDFPTVALRLEAALQSRRNPDHTNSAEVEA